jgi:hypothetical protein
MSRDDGFLVLQLADMALQLREIAWKNLGYQDSLCRDNASKELARFHDLIESVTTQLYTREKKQCQSCLS